MKFIGRQQELKTLSKFLKKKTSSMIVVQGRRRPWGSWYRSTAKLVFLLHIL